jgi:hypothetical protein
MQNKSDLYSVYYSETTGKYFVKFINSPEKEITKTEYIYLLEEKQRINNKKIKNE